MHKPVRSRPIIAVIAAYVVVLQALLLPLAVAAGNPLIGSICGAATGGAQTPAGHQNGCPCAGGCGMQCHAHAVLGRAPAAVVVTLTVVHVMAPAVVLKPGVRVATRTPQIPRAPPVA